MRGIVAALLAAGPGGRVLHAQYLTRPHLSWRTVETEHFTIHFPAEMREWSERVAQHIESVASEVNAVVGNRPATRVTVLVEDPSNVSNGFALPFLEAPVIFLWPTPPSPSPTFGVHRGWGEILAVHEYAHIAHLTFPSRNPREQLLWRFMPTRVGPVARNTPPWVFEGYATLVEGQLTGSGRPSSVGRAAVLRQWALEGKLPTYVQLNSTRAFLGGSMRYLLGSAYLEWLQERKGDSSLVHLWRRMSARQQRSFGSAFAGVFGAPPDDLYGRFFVEVIAKSLEIERTLVRAGLVDGELVQRLHAGTGDPAISPDGKRVALVRRSLTDPPRLVVWNADAEPDDSARVRARQRLLERDPLDVPAIDSFPPPRREIATLHPVAGRSHELPRWMPDGVHLLVSRDEPVGFGATRPDLFLWNHRTGTLRRVTQGAAIRHADPSPDGTQAAAVRCHAGSCSLVLVDLARGDWRILAAGSPEIVWHRPRWSPDGTAIAAGRHAEGRWQVALVDVASGRVRVVDPPDGAARYAPAFTRSGRELVVVSERGGIPNLELLPLDGSEPRTLTRVTGAAAAPDVRHTDARVYFLALHAEGYDLRRIAIDSATTAASVVTIDPSLAPAAPAIPRVPPVHFAAADIGPAQHYGLGPRRWRLLPGGSIDADGLLGTVMLGNVDPISRLSVLAQGGYGERGTWQGGSLAAGLRAFPVEVDGAVWHVEQRPSERDAALASPSADLRFTGIGAMADVHRERGMLGLTLRAGGSWGRVNTPGLDDASRLVGMAEGRLRVTFGLGRLTMHGLATSQYQHGSTGGESWGRTIAAGAITLGRGNRFVRGDMVLGNGPRPDAGEVGRAFESFVVGGSALPYMDGAHLAHRVPLPMVPTGFVAGRRFGLYRVGLSAGTLPGLSLEPYMLWVAAGDSLTAWKRIAGAEQTIAVPSLGFARLPAVRVRVGAGYSFDEPFQYRIRGYAGITYRP